MRIALVGATSHIALNLVSLLSPLTEVKLELFARNTKRVVDFLSSRGIPRTRARPRDIEEFASQGDDYDAIVNCIGFGTPEKIRAAGWRIFQTTELFDNLIMAKLDARPDTVYVNFSSGAVFGRNRDGPVAKGESIRLMPDEFAEADSYAMAKLNSEAKHRAAGGLSVIDLRIFSFFTRHIDLSSSYLVSDMVNAVREDRAFLTEDADITRDFVAPEDLASLVLKCATSQGLNAAMDVYSRGEITKRTLIELFVARYGMRVEYRNSGILVPPTGGKTYYCSENYAAADLVGYAPTMSSRETILIEADAILCG